MPPSPYLTRGARCDRPRPEHRHGHWPCRTPCERVRPLWLPPSTSSPRQFHTAPFAPNHSHHVDEFLNADTQNSISSLTWCSNVISVVVFVVDFVKGTVRARPTGWSSNSTTRHPRGFRRSRCLDFGKCSKGFNSRGALVSGPALDERPDHDRRYARSASGTDGSARRSALTVAPPRMR